MSDYGATYQQIQSIEPIEGADKIEKARVANVDVVVGKGEYQPGDVVIFFPEGCQINREYAVKHMLIRWKDPATGENKGGLLEDNCRVRAITLRGVKSQGLVMKGDYASEILIGEDCYLRPGVPLATKYISPQTQRIRASQKQGKPRVNHYPMFKEHFDTENIERRAHELVKDEPVIITEKLHGTSGRLGKVKFKIPIPRTWWEKLLKRPVRYHEGWTVLNGSRRVVLDWEQIEDTYREDCVRGVGEKLHKGETIYYEIVGYEPGGKPIMPAHNRRGKWDGLQNAAKGFGNDKNEIVYHYGQAPGTCKAYVYRITMTNEDGVSVDYGWEHVERRSKELGLDTVPTLQYALWDPDKLETAPTVIDGLPTRLGGGHHIEGVCVRQGDRVYKLKTHSFKVLEGLVPDDAVDTEEVS